MITNHEYSAHSNHPYCRHCKATAAEHAVTVTLTAAEHEQVVRMVRRLAQSHESLRQQGRPEYDPDAHAAAVALLSTVTGHPTVVR